MSLINQMLRDLDARRAPAAERAPLQNEVHAAPQRGGRNWPLLALASALTLAAAAGVWYWTKVQSAPPVQPQASAPVQPQASAPAQPPAPPQPQPQPQPAPPPAAVAQAAAPAPVQASAELPVFGPKLSEFLQEVPHRAPARAEAAKDNAPATMAEGSSARDKRNAAPAAAPSLRAAAAAATSIDKRPHASVANEVAENEYNKAVFALRRGASAEAIDRLHAVLRLDAQHVFARQALLSLLMRQEQWAEAQTLAAEGLALDPTQTGWAMALARLQMENGKLAEATETLARHAAYAGQSADYQAFQALLLQKQKRYREASERYTAAVSLRPAEGRWWYGLGLSLEAEQKPQEARDAFLKAREAGDLPQELAGALKQHLR
ncbi:MAG: tetratricopeptide repeat protein [Rhodocyclaceae bacterium]|nr:tetratricopeptide repeat protein [Rhodocyclaceae bacterium]